MRKKEPAALLKMLRMVQHATVSRECIDKLKSSGFFQLGWRRCRERLKGSVEFLVRSTPSELDHYVRSPER